MKNYDYIRYHGIGNDYIVIDQAFNTIPMTVNNIRKICDRNFGIGSDGILYVPFFHGELPMVKIFNTDGSEAEKSGNGIRIFAKYLFDTGYIKDRKFVVNTLGGPVQVEYLDTTGNLIKVEMGRATFLSKEIPTLFSAKHSLSKKIKVNGVNYKVNCVSVGNPHCVIVMDEISPSKVKEIGPILESHPMFPHKINVQIMKVLDRKNIQIEIYERGVGYTLASGSSSCACACVAKKVGLTDAQVNVHMPGGSLAIRVDKWFNITLTGTVHSIAKGIYTDEFRNSLERHGELAV